MKIFGSILILFSSVLTSYYYEKSLKKKIKICEDGIDFISYVKVQIEYFSNPINVIFENYNLNTDIKELLENKKNHKIFGNELDKNLYDFFTSIGKGFKKEQLSLCDYTLTSLNSELLKMKSDYPSKSKVFRSLSMFFGICAIILLI